MNKSLHLVGRLAISAAFLTGINACDNSDKLQPEAEPSIDESPKTYVLTVTATKGDDDATRALTLEGGTLIATWAEGETVHVYSVIGSGAVEIESTDPVALLTAQGNGVTAKLTGTFFNGYTPRLNEKLRLKHCTDSYNNQKGTLEYIAANCDYAIADVTITDIGTEGDITTTAASFQNQSAIVKFSIKKQDGTPILATRSSVTVGSRTYDITLDQAASEIFVALPGTSNKKILLTASCATGSFAYEKTGVTFKKGQYYTIGVKMGSYTMSKALTDVTESEIGWRVGSDGKAYEPIGALPEGVTPVAMIGSISGKGHGLAIELNGTRTVWTSALENATTGKPSIPGGTWRLPSLNDWINIITGCAVAGDQTEFAPSSPSLSPIDGFRQKCLAAGFFLKQTEITPTGLWTSTELPEDMAYSITLVFWHAHASAEYYESSKNSLLYALACLEF